MSAKKKRYPARVGWIGWNDGNRFHWKNRENGHQTRVRVTDARDPTVEQAIADTITRNVYLNGDGPINSTHVPEGYSARVVNGNVIVRRIKQ